VTTNSADDMPRQRPRVTVEELARRKGVRPIESLDDTARDVFASEDELDHAAGRRRIEDDFRAGLVKIGSCMLRGWP